MTPPSPRTSSSALSKYLTKAGDLPRDVLLGRIVFFTITDEGIARDDLVQWFKDAKLDESLLPPEIKAVDAFLKATSEAKESYELPNGRTAYVLCRDVTSNNELIRRQITREIKDAKRKSLSYAPGISATFYRGVGAKARLDLRLNTQDLERGEKQHMEQIAKAISARFTRYYKLLDGNKLRAVVRNYLKGPLNAIEVKGGVYFVHASKDDELARLAEVVNKFGGGCKMNAIPIVNIEREREFIASAFEQQASSALGDIAKKAKELKDSGRKITPAVYDKFKAEYDDLLARAQEHMVTLEVSQDLTAAAAEVALKSLKALQKEITS
jgi:hypothetical protein